MVKSMRILGKLDAYKEMVKFRNKIIFESILEIHKFEPKNKYIEDLEDTSESDTTSFSDNWDDDITLIHTNKNFKAFH